MIPEVQQAIQTLRNTQAGWATRKETAQKLGATIQKALQALHDHTQDADHDVRRAVHAALDLLTTQQRETLLRDFALQELAQACEKKDTRTVTPHQDGYTIDVRIDQTRTQRVYLTPQTRNDGTRLLRIYTLCGKPDTPTTTWALRANTRLTNCAFALENHQGTEHIILNRNFERDKASPAETALAVKEIAFYGDWLEKKITGHDEL